MRAVIFIFFLFVSNAHALDCRQMNGFRLEDKDGGLRIETCFGVAIKTDYLLDALNKFRGDAQFVAALKRIEIGNDFDSIYKNIEDYGYAAYLVGAKSDQKYMDYILSKLNSIEEEKYAENLKRETEFLKRRLIPLNIKLPDLALMAEENKSTSDAIVSADCRTRPDLENKMKAIEVNFEDGDSQSFVPLNVKKINANAYEFELLTGDTGSHNANQNRYRTIKYENGKYIWVSYNGKEYPIDRFSEFKTDEEAIGMEFGVQNSQNMVCRYQRFLREHIRSRPAATAR